MVEIKIYYWIDTMGQFIPSEYNGVKFGNARIELRSKITTHENMFTLLHELGHYYWIEKRGYKISVREYKDYNPKQRVREEIRAWGYVYACTKKKYHKEIWKHAEWALGTYEAWQYMSKTKAKRLIWLDSRNVR